MRSLNSDLAHEIDLTVSFKTMSLIPSEQWLSEVKNADYILTVLAPELSDADIDAVSQLLVEQGLMIKNKARLTGLPVSVAHENLASRACVQLTLTGQLIDAQVTRQALLALSQQRQIDLALQSSTAYCQPRRLICFDMDSTLIGQEVIDELAKEAGVGEQVAEITERAMQGELDFQASFRARVALLKGMDASVLASIAERLTINEGAAHLISTLKLMGYRTAILSGGFQYFAEYLQMKLGLDEVHANILDIQDGVVTGEVKGDIMDGARKALFLGKIAEEMGISLEQTVAVGDGANDLPMLGLAGLGVAYHAKPLVRQTAQQAISNIGLDGVLYLLGVHAEEIHAL